MCVSVCLSVCLSVGMAAYQYVCFGKSVCLCLWGVIEYDMRQAFTEATNLVPSHEVKFLPLIWSLDFKIGCSDLTQR